MYMWVCVRCVDMYGQIALVEVTLSNMRGYAYLFCLDVKLNIFMLQKPIYNRLERVREFNNPFSASK